MTHLPLIDNPNDDGPAEPTVDLPIDVTPPGRAPEVAAGLPTYLVDHLNTAREQAPVIAGHDLDLRYVLDAVVARVTAIGAEPSRVLNDPKPEEVPAREKRLAQERLDEGLKGIAADVEARLAAAADRFRAALAEHPTLTSADLLQVREWVEQLKVLTPRFAVPIFRRILVKEVTAPHAKPEVRARAGALIPLLKSLYERDPIYADPSVRQLVREAELAQRSAAWHGAVHGLMTVERTRWQVAALIARAREHGGAVTAPARYDATTGEYVGPFKDLGLVPPPPPEAS